LKELKKIILDKCREIFREKSDQLNAAIASINESLTSETKSSVGDKHETSRARLQAERENLGRQLLDFESKQNTFERAVSSKTGPIVSNGVLITTDHGLFLMATSLGKIVAGDHTVLVISSEAPLGKALMGKTPGESVEFNGVNYLIREIS